MKQQNKNYFGFLSQTALSQNEIEHQNKYF
jgi:hypothetical protein